MEEIKLPNFEDKEHVATEGQGEISIENKSTRGSIQNFSENNPGRRLARIKNLQHI